MGETVISLQNVQKNYGKHKVLSGVNLEIEKGCIYGLIGKNGAGKTTIFKIILGLSDYQEGTLLFCGKANNESEGRKKIGFFVGQNFFSYMSAKQNLEYYCRLKGVKRSEADRVLKLVELDQVKSSFKNYSMGMRQRLGIANALLGGPEILILDEPTNGLDPQGIADVRKLIQRLNEEYGMTIVVSSHILGELQNTAHIFGIVNNGIVAKVVTQEDLNTQTNTVRISVDDLEKAKKALADAGVSVLSAKNEMGSLEDFYFHLVQEDTQEKEEQSC